MESITTIKKIAKLDKAELRYATLKGTDKFDLRIWKDDEHPGDGIRFSDKEIVQLEYILCGIKKFEKSKKLGEVGAFEFASTETGYTFIAHAKDGRVAHRDFSSEDMMALKKIFTDAVEMGSVDKTLASNLMNYDPDKVVEVLEIKEEPVKKKAGRPKKTEATKSSKDKVVKFEKKKKEYKNAYEKFVGMFEEYRQTISEERRKGFELTHKIITDHIKDIIETSDDYNKNAMQEWKNSHNMMTYIQNKIYENAEELMSVMTRDEANRYICQWCDEYIGLDDKPKEKAKKKA